MLSCQTSTPTQAAGTTAGTFPDLTSPLQTQLEVWYRLLRDLRIARTTPLPPTGGCGVGLHGGMVPSHLNNQFPSSLAMPGLAVEQGSPSRTSLPHREGRHPLHL